MKPRSFLFWFLMFPAALWVWIPLTYGQEEYHGADSVFETPDLIILWAILKGPDEEHSWVYIKIVFPGDGPNPWQTFRVEAVDPFSREKEWVTPREKGEKEKPHPIRVEGFDVQVSDAGAYIVSQEDGRDVLMTVEEYSAKLAESVMREVPSVNALRQHWIVPEARQLLLEHLPDGERGAKMLRQVMGLTEYDLYDVLADISFGIDPKTRASA